MVLNLKLVKNKSIKLTVNIILKLVIIYLKLIKLVIHIDEVFFNYKQLISIKTKIIIIKHFNYFNYIY